MTFAMILSYKWQNDSCFPGQAKLAEDMGVDERTVRRHIQALQVAGLLVIPTEGAGKDQHLRAESVRGEGEGTPGAPSLDRTKMSGLDRT